MNYIMHTPEEGLRVERKTDRGLTIEQLEWAGIQQGMRVLDLGCAAGTTCRIMADLVGESGRIIGVDVSARRLSEAKAHVSHRPWIEYRQGAAEKLPAANAEFDLCWSRFLFEYLEEPAIALAEMIRVTKPGATVCVSDIDGNCIWHYPRENELDEEIQEALHTFGRSFNPRAGLSLYTLFVDAGMRGVVADLRPYHLIAGKIDPDRAAEWKMKLDGVVIALQARGWSESRASRLSAALMSHLHNPRTLTYSALFTVRGRVGEL
ncbi:MAG: methyltransferase domain-containing protein [Phycisphaerales bacterium]|nr:methyltransferase domain-containing protein [Phycisphaerales bacterium]